MYKIRTVGDLIEELKKYDQSMLIKKLDITPSDIARIKVQDCHEYKFGGNGEIESTYKAVVIR